jgi:hypothetical protein
MKIIKLIAVFTLLVCFVSCGEPEVDCGEQWLSQVGEARQDYENEVNDCLNNPFSDDLQDADCLKQKATQFGLDISQAEHDKKCCTGEINCNGEI